MKLNDELFNNCPRPAARDFKKQLDIILSRLEGGLSFLSLQQCYPESIFYLFDCIENDLARLKGLYKDGIKSGAFLPY